MCPGRVSKRMGIQGVASSGCVCVPGGVHTPEPRGRHPLERQSPLDPEADRYPLGPVNLKNPVSSINLPNFTEMYFLLNTLKSN